MTAARPVRPAPPPANAAPRPGAPRAPRPLAGYEVFAAAAALCRALPAEPPVLRREAVEVIAALGAGLADGSDGALRPALREARRRCGRLLGLLSALAPAQLSAHEAGLRDLHGSLGRFLRYLEKKRDAQANPPRQAAPRR